MDHKGITVLGLESSCDDSAAAIVKRHPCGSIEVLSEIVLGQNDEHAPYGGVVPEIAARAHCVRMDVLARKVLHQARLDADQLSAVAATAGPGLVGGVMAALMTGKGIALGANIPLIAVNHLEGHALSPRLTQTLDFPYLLLLVSGGHTQLLLVKDIDQMTRLGTTIDDAAGEAFDKSAKLMGLGFPGGPQLERYALLSDCTERFKLPHILAKDQSCNFSFSGLKTAAKRIWDQLKSHTQADRADLSAGIQFRIASHLAERTGRAMQRVSKDLGDNKICVIAGGVAANQAVRRALLQSAQTNGYTCIFPPLKYCTDNAAMIALAGLERLRRGLIDDLSVPARARWPLDGDVAKQHPVSAFGRKGPKA